MTTNSCRLDPAGPLFSLDDPANRLHHTDANYVESIITDAGRLGFMHPVSGTIWIHIS